MKCTKCKKDIPNTAKFCLYCGTAVPVKKISLRCEKCMGTLEIEGDKEILVCPYCGNKELIIEDNEIKIEKIRTAAYKEIELEKIKSRDKYRQMNEEKSIREEQKIQTENFKKSKLSKFLISAFIIASVSTFLNFSNNRILAGLLSVVQVICFGLAWIMGMQIIKEKRRYIHICLAVLGVIFTVPHMNSCSIDNGEIITEINWNVIFLGDEIPQPKSKKIEIHENTEKDLWIDVYDINEGDYYEYIIACKEMGYLIEAEETSMDYDAYNEEKYYLNLGYSKYNKKLSISVDAPVSVGEITWSNHTVAAILPEPSSKVGAFQVENDKRIEIVISDNSYSDFLEYVKACELKGFSIEAETKKDSYAAYNENGYKLRLYYTSGDKNMSIKIEYPMVFKDIIWPKVGVGTLIPIPKSLSGNVASDYGWVYSVYIENISREEYEKYVQKCIKKGFDKNIRNYENSVWADYSDEIDIHIEYKGFNIMYISVSGSPVEDYSDYK